MEESDNLKDFDYMGEINPVFLHKGDQFEPWTTPLDHNLLQLVPTPISGLKRACIKIEQAFGNPSRPNRHE